MVNPNGFSAETANSKPEIIQTAEKATNCKNRTNRIIINVNIMLKCSKKIKHVKLISSFA